METKFTKGEWVIVKTSVPGMIVIEVKTADKNIIKWPVSTVAPNQHNHITISENEGIAVIICDAANTYNKTGFTPSELAKQVEEMREALEMLYNAFPMANENGDMLFGVHQLLTKYPKQ